MDNERKQRMEQDSEELDSESLREQKRVKERVHFENALDDRIRTEMQAEVTLRHELKCQAIRISEDSKLAIELDKNEKADQADKMQLDLGLMQQKLDQMASNHTAELQQMAAHSEQQLANITQAPGGQVCFQFRDQGQCNWGPSCRFLHDGTPAVPQSTQSWHGRASRGGRGGHGGRGGKGGKGGRGGGKGRSQSTCFSWQNGHCTRGGSCHFQHSNPPPGTQPEPCRNFGRGHCLRGTTCRFSHNLAQAPPNQPRPNGSAAPIGAQVPAQAPVNPQPAPQPQPAAAAAQAPAPAVLVQNVPPSVQSLALRAAYDLLRANGHDLTVPRP
jgi:hypothetical protein